MAHPSAAPAVDARTLRFRLGWSGDTSAGSRLLSQRKEASANADDPAAFEGHRHDATTRREAGADHPIRTHGNGDA
jgi:hypothetical protein